MPSDEQLLLRMQGGDDAALEQLVDRYYDAIYQYLARMLMDAGLAEDFTQECFMKLCDTVKRGKLPAVLRPWIYRVAGNLCRDYWRKASTRFERMTEDDRLAIHPDHDNVASIVEMRWEREEIVRMLGRLHADERQMIVLRFYHDWKLSDIAELMELPTNTLKTRFYKVLNRMAVWMQDGEVDGGERRNA